MSARTLFTLKVNLQGFSSGGSRSRSCWIVFFLILRKFCIQETKERKEAALTLASILTEFVLVPRAQRCVTSPSIQARGTAACQMPFASRRPWTDAFLLSWSAVSSMCARHCQRLVPNGSNAVQLVEGVGGCRRRLKTLTPRSLKAKHPLWAPSQ